MKCSDRNQLENMASFIDFVALLIELHIWRNDIKYSSFQDASIDIKISQFEWSLELHINCAFSFIENTHILYNERIENSRLYETCCPETPRDRRSSGVSGNTSSNRRIFHPRVVYG
jgi:hypothetical protein